MVLLALTLLLSYPHARLTGIEGMMKIVIFVFWILLQVACHLLFIPIVLLLYTFCFSLFFAVH